MLNIFLSYPSAFSRLLSGRARPPIIKDEMLGLVSLGSWVAHLLIESEEVSCLQDPFPNSFVSGLLHELHSVAPCG